MMGARARATGKHRQQYPVPFVQPVLYVGLGIFRDVRSINNCANVLKQLERFDEALQRYDNALGMWPDYAEAAYNRGVTLGKLGRPKEALKSYVRALEINPEYLDARYNLAHCRLQLGDFVQGWKADESQWQKSLLARNQPAIVQPLWLGAESVKGKTILLLLDATRACINQPRQSAAIRRRVFGVLAPAVRFFYLRIEARR
jgi:tetratricopeptide (TPR) repeat protein